MTLPSGYPVFVTLLVTVRSLTSIQGLEGRPESFYRMGWSGIRKYQDNGSVGEKNYVYRRHKIS